MIRTSTYSKAYGIGRAGFAARTEVINTRPAPYLSIRNANLGFVRAYMALAAISEQRALIVSMDIYTNRRVKFLGS